jgi:hypothetical protein
VNEQAKTVTWDAVPHSSGYIVDIDGEEKPSISEISYSLKDLTEYKTYQIKVKAKGNGKKYYDSDWSAVKCYTVSASAPAPTAYTK